MSMLLRALLGSSSCKGVLRLWRVRELVQESHGLDLDAFACSQGYEDVLSFLQDHLPGLECRWPEQGENSIIHLRPGVKAEDGGDPGMRTCPRHLGSQLCLPL